MLGFILNGYAFVGAHSRIGHTVARGPVTGKEWSITLLGSWIDEEDAEVLTDNIVDVWCNCAGGKITINPVLYLNPSADQVRSAPQ